MRVMMIGPFPRAADKIDGGVAAATTYLSQALAKREDVELIGVRVARDDRDQREERSFGWPIVDLPLGRLSLTTNFLPQRRRLRELLARYEPQVVHAQGADLAGLLAVSCGRPAVITAHGMLAECARYQTNAVNRLRASLSAAVTERPTIRRARDLIAISPYVARHYRAEIRGRVHDVPNAIGAAFFDVARASQRGRFLYAGRIAFGKGLEELVRAVAQSRDVVRELILAGATPDNAYGQRLRDEIAALGVGERIRFAGLLSEPQLVDEFAKAEALILPSHQETAPMVVQQAMAAGLAVLATNVGGIPDQIRHDVSGLIFEPGDAGGLAALLSRFAAEPGLASRLGEVARGLASRFYQADSVAERTVSVYQIALSEATRHEN